MDPVILRTSSFIEKINHQNSVGSAQLEILTLRETVDVCSPIISEQELLTHGK